MAIRNLSENLITTSEHFTLIARAKRFMSGFTTNGFTVLYFFALFLFVGYMEKQDAKNDSVLGQIKGEFDRTNGTRELFENIVRFKDGKELTVKGSLFSINTIRYRLVKDYSVSSYEYFAKTAVSNYAGDYFKVDNNVFQITTGEKDVITVYPVKCKECELRLINRTPVLAASDSTLIRFKPIPGSSKDTVPLFSDLNTSQTKHFISQKDYEQLFLKDRQFKDLGAFVGYSHIYTFRHHTNIISYSDIHDAQQAKSGVKGLVIPELDSIISVEEMDRDTNALVQVRGFKKLVNCQVIFNPNNPQKRTFEKFWSDYLPTTDDHIDTNRSIIVNNDGQSFILKFYGRRHVIRFPKSKSHPLKKSLSVSALPSNAFGSEYLLTAYLHSQESDEQAYFKTTGDTLYSFGIQKPFFNNIINDVAVFQNSVSTENNHDSLSYFNLKLGSKPKVYKLGSKNQDSLFFPLLSSSNFLSDVLNFRGVGLFFPDEGRNFFIVHRDIDGNVIAEFDSSTWKFQDYAKRISYSVTYDTYYITILVSAIIILYFLGLIAINAFKINQQFDLQKIPLFNIHSLDYKLNSIFINMETLKRRSEIMLILGVFFGVFGVLISAFVFQTANLDLKGSWGDPHTYIYLLKPIVILVFMETFTFYFLKQYRIIFNEFKLFYSVFMQSLNINVLADLNLIGSVAAEPELYSLLKTKLNTETFVLYENGTKSQIDEFEHKSMLDLIGKIKEATK